VGLEGATLDGFKEATGVASPASERMGEYLRAALPSSGSSSSRYGIYRYGQVE